MTLALSLATALSLVAPVQDSNAFSISSDRPGVTVKPATLAKGGLQLEFGYTQIQGNGTTSHLWGGMPLVRYGWSDNIELRFGLPSYLVTRDGLANPEGLTQAGFAVKYALKPAVGGAPALSLLAGTTLITGSTNFRADRLQPYLDLLAQWNLDETHAVSANLGVQRLSDGTGSTYDQKTFAVQYAWTQGKLHPFVEAYAILPDSPGGQNSQYVRGGVKYTIVPGVLQFDWFADRGLNGGGRDYEFGAGLTFWFR